MYKALNDELDVDDLQALPVCDVIVYHYTSEPYEGSGHIICRHNHLWYHNTLNHCSCYGPSDNFEFTDGYDTMHELLEHCTEDLKQELKPVTDELYKFFPEAFEKAERE